MFFLSVLPRPGSEEGLAESGLPFICSALVYRGISPPSVVGLITGNSAVHDKTVRKKRLKSKRIKI